MDANQRSAPKTLGADLLLPLLGVAYATYYLSTIIDLRWESKATAAVICGALFVLTTILVAKILWQVAVGGATLRLGALAAWDAAQAQRIALVAALGVFVATLPYLGFTLAVFLLMLIQMLVLGVRAPRRLLGVAFAVAAGGYLLFVALVKTNLPHGPVEHLLARVF